MSSSPASAGVIVSSTSKTIITSSGWGMSDVEYGCGQRVILRTAHKITHSREISYTFSTSQLLRSAFRNLIVGTMGNAGMSDSGYSTQARLSDVRLDARVGSLCLSNYRCRSWRRVRPSTATPASRNPLTPFYGPVQIDVSPGTLAT